MFEVLIVPVQSDWFKVFVVIPSVKLIVLFIFNVFISVGGNVIDGVLFTVVYMSLNNKLWPELFDNCCELIFNILPLIVSFITIELLSGSILTDFIKSNSYNLVFDHQKSNLTY